MALYGRNIYKVNKQKPKKLSVAYSGKYKGFIPSGYKYRECPKCNTMCLNIRERLHETKPDSIGCHPRHKCGG